MASIVFDANELKAVVDVAVEAALRRMQDERSKDATGKILLTKAEAAEAMGVSQKTIDRWRSERGLPHLKLDTGKPMFRPEAIREWAKEHESALANGG